MNLRSENLHNLDECLLGNSALLSLILSFELLLYVKSLFQAQSPESFKDLLSINFFVYYYGSKFSLC